MTQDSDSDFYESVKLFLNCFIDFLIENKEVLPVMQKNISSCIKNIPEFFSSEISDLYNSFIQKMVELGYTPENAHITAFIVIDMTGSVCSDAILHKKPFPIEKIRNTVIESAISIIKHNATLSRGDNSETLN